MRLFKIGLILLLTTFFVTSTSNAVEFTVIGPNSGTINSVGGSITIDIALDNINADLVQGIVATITGLAAPGLTVTAGQSAPAFFVGSCSPSGCIDGIDTLGNSFFDPNDLSLSGAYTAGDDSVVIVSALAFPGTGGTSFSGALDPGLDGPINVPSVRDVTIQLTALSGLNPGIYDLIIGGEYSDGTSVLTIMDTAVFTLTIVPEPGTALLMGLGLMGLVTVRGADSKVKQRFQHHR